MSRLEGAERARRLLAYTGVGPDAIAERGEQLLNRADHLLRLRMRLASLPVSGTCGHPQDDHLEEVLRGPAGEGQAMVVLVGHHGGAGHCVSQSVCRAGLVASIGEL